jgi:hypothetical protein
MKQRRLISVLLLGLGAAGAFFAVAIIIGGGSNSVALQTPGFSEKKTTVQPATVNLTSAASEVVVGNMTTTQKTAKKTTPPNPQTIANLALVTAMANFNPDDFVPTVQSSSFNITADASPESERRYLASLIQILRNTNISASSSAEHPNFEAILAAYTQAEVKLTAVRVPITLVEMHRDALKLFGAQQNIIAVLKNHNADPIQAYLAAESEPMIVDRIQTLQADISTFLSATPNTQS